MKNRNEILTTTNYDLFKFVEGNRPTVISTKMKQSMQAVGWIASSPLICNQKHEVLDGQHRLLVAMELGIPVYYSVEVTKNRVHDNQIITTLNKNQKMWRLQDWIHHFAENGLKSHRIIRDFEEKHRLGISNSIILCLGGSSNSGMIRTGKELKLNPNRESVAQYIHKCNALFFHRSSKFVAAVTILFDRASQTHIDKLFSKHMIITEQASISSYLAVFENIINSGQRQSTLRLQKQ